MDNFLARNLIREKEVLSIFIEFDQSISNGLILQVYILINKFYPSYKIKSIDHNTITPGMHWEDLILGNFKLTSEHSMIVNLTIPLRIQKDDSGECFTHYMDAMCIYYGLEESTNRNSIGVELYGNVYTNYRYDYILADNSYIAVNQIESASYNRRIFTKFLIELEAILDGEVTEYLSSYVQDNGIFRYGFTESAAIQLSE